MKRSKLYKTLENFAYDIIYGHPHGLIPTIQKYETKIAAIMLKAVLDERKKKRR